MDGALATPVLDAGEAQTVYARVRIAAKKLPRRDRGPVNVALVLDTSGSMEGAAIVELKRASLEMVDALEDGDRLAIIAFHSKTEVLLESVELDAGVRRSAKRAIEGVRALGTTDMAGGLDEGMRQVRAHLDPKGVNRVVLVGDGIPNQPGVMEDVARNASETGIAITTLGLGLDYDEVLMGRLAQLSGGRYKYVDSADKVAAFFRDELDRIDNVYARQAIAVLTAGPGVKIESVLNVPGGGGAGSSARVPLGDIARGDQRDLIVELTVKPRKASVPIELLDVSITFDDALENAGKLERRVYFGAYASDDDAAIAKARNPDVELSAALAKASAVTLRALDAANAGSYVQARALLTTGAEVADAQAKKTPSPELDKLAANMRATAKDLPAEDRPRPAGRENEPSYEFTDDALSGESFQPAVKARMKEVHQQAIDRLQ